jgi:hypothetical protein
LKTKKALTTCSSQGSLECSPNSKIGFFKC